MLREDSTSVRWSKSISWILSVVRFLIFSGDGSFHRLFISTRPSRPPVTLCFSMCGCCCWSKVICMFEEGTGRRSLRRRSRQSVTSADCLSGKRISLNYGKIIKKICKYPTFCDLYISIQLVFGNYLIGQRLVEDITVLLPLSSIY